MLFQWAERKKYKNQLTGCYLELVCEGVKSGKQFGTFYKYESNLNRLRLIYITTKLRRNGVFLKIQTNCVLFLPNGTFLND